jgi:hypothetical protein
MIITRILDRESVVDNVVLCLKKCWNLLFAVNVEEYWHKKLFTILTLYLIWYKWLWKQFRNWNLSFSLTPYTVQILSKWYTTQNCVTWMPLCIQVEAKDVMHTLLYTQTETFSAAGTRKLLNWRNSCVDNLGDDLKMIAYLLLCEFCRIINKVNCPNILNSPYNINAVIFTRWREWSGLCHSHFTPGKSHPSSHSIERSGEE